MHEYANMHAQDVHFRVYFSSCAKILTYSLELERSLMSDDDTYIHQCRVVVVPRSRGREVGTDQEVLP